jgi:hypothetical protein
MVGVTQTGTDAATVHRVHVDVDSDVPLSTHVVEAVATATGVDATTGFDFYDAVDADALDMLHRHARRTDTTWELVFDVTDCEVSVTSDGTVTVR